MVLSRFISKHKKKNGYRFKISDTLLTGSQDRQREKGFLAQVLLSTRASNQFEFWLATVPSFLVTAYKLKSESTYSRIKMHSRLISPYPLSKQYGHSLDKDDNIFRKLCFGFLIIAWPLGLPKFLGSQFSMAILEIVPIPECSPSLGSLGHVLPRPQKL